MSSAKTLVHDFGIRLVLAKLDLTYIVTHWFNIFVARVSEIVHLLWVFSRPCYTTRYIAWHPVVQLLVIVNSWLWPAWLADLSTKSKIWICFICAVVGWCTQWSCAVCFKILQSWELCVAALYKWWSEMLWWRLAAESVSHHMMCTSAALC